MLLLQYLDVYCLEHDLAPKSALQIRYTITSLQKFAGVELALGDLTDELINRWLVDQQEAGLSSQTVRGKRVNLLSLWRAAYDARLVDTQPGRIRKIKRYTARPVAWTADEVRRILHAAHELNHGSWFANTGIERSLYWQAKIRFAWDTGLRTGDLHRVERSWIDPDGTLWVRQNKTTEWLRRGLHASTVEAVDKTYGPERPLLFPLWSRVEEVYKQFRKIVAAAGLKGTFKKIRKSGATNCEAREPGSAEEYLGHARPQTTAERNYIDRRLIGERVVMPEEL